MRPENRIKLNYREVVLYVGNQRTARRVYRSLLRNRRSAALTVYEVDGWILRNLPRGYWPPGLEIDGVRPERAAKAVRRDYGMRLPPPRGEAHGAS